MDTEKEPLENLVRLETHLNMTRKARRKLSKHIAHRKLRNDGSDTIKM